VLGRSLIGTIINEAGEETNWFSVLSVYIRRTTFVDDSKELGGVDSFGL
jgi:hypothetical protein